MWRWGDVTILRGMFSTVCKGDIRAKTWNTWRKRSLGRGAGTGSAKAWGEDSLVCWRNSTYRPVWLEGVRGEETRGKSEQRNSGSPSHGALLPLRGNGMIRLKHFSKQTFQAENKGCCPKPGEVEIEAWTQVMVKTDELEPLVFPTNHHIWFLGTIICDQRDMTF